MPIFNVNGQDVHVIESGHPNRQIAMLIHGWSSSWYAMSPLIGLMSQRFRVLAVDLPGYGKSPKLNKRTTIEDYVDLLADLLESESDGPVVLIGHSMGGMISLHLAIKYPALVERMVLICPTITGKLSTYINLVVFPVTLAESLPFSKYISKAIEGAIVGLTDRIMRPASFAERTGITQEDYHRIRADARRPDQGQVRAECFSAMRDNDLSPRIQNTETPALVLWGAEDNTVPLRDAGVVADEWPMADLRILPKAGHWPHFEQPDNIKRLIASFLGVPLVVGELAQPVTDEEFARTEEIAQFLAHSDVGNDLNLTQRMRLGAQFQQRFYDPGETIVNIKDVGSEMFLIQDGTVEVWSDPDNPGELTENFRKVATLRPGQISGELALFDEGLRSADMIAGNMGATVLAITRDVVHDLCEDDPILGARFLWNMSRAMSHRVRFIQWQFRRARQREEEGKRVQVR